MKKYIVTQRPVHIGLSSLAYICEARSKAEAIRKSGFKKEQGYNMPHALPFKEATTYLI